MANINDSIQYTANAAGSPTAPVTYTWSIGSGTSGTDWNVTAGSLGSPISLSQITIQWLTAGSYTIAVTAINSCSNVTDTETVIVNSGGGGGCNPITSVTIS